MNFSRMKMLKLTRRGAGFTVFQHFHVREIHFRQPFFGLTVIRVFIIEYVGEEISKIIKFGHFLRFSGANSAEKCRKSTPKDGKYASQ